MRKGEFLMKKIVLALLFASAAVYLGVIWQRQMFIPDEPRYAEIAREMLASGDWIKPALCGLDYYEKPILGYWMNALSCKVFGDTVGAVRFMPALTTLLAALLLGVFAARNGERELDRYTVPLWFLTFAFVFGIGTYGVLDAQFSFFVTATLCCFFFACEEKRKGMTAVFLVLAGVAAGCAFLTKGLPGFVLPAAAAGGFLIWRKDWKKLFTCWILPLVFALLVIAPWAWAIDRRDPDFWRYFIVVEHLERAFNPERDQHPQNFFFFFLCLPAVLLPATVFAGAVWKGFAGRVREAFRPGSALNFALCAALLPMIVLSCSRGKLLTYILPCLPWFAVIWNEGANRYLESGTEKKKYWDLPLNILLYTVAAAGAGLFLYEKIIRYAKLSSSYLLYFEEEPYFVVSLAAVAAAVLWKVSTRSEEPEHKTSAFFAGALLLMAVGHAAAPLRFCGKLAPAEPFRMHVVPLLAGRPDVILVADKNILPCACYELRRTDVKLIGSPNELDYGLAKPSGAGRHVDAETLSALIRSGRPVVAAVTSESRLKGLPAPRAKLTDRRYKMIVARYNL